MRGNYIEPFDVLNSHPRDLDELLYRLLTRISSKFKRQREERIILGAGLVRHHDPNILGYRINIPIEAIKKVYTRWQNYFSADLILPIGFPFIQVRKTRNRTATGNISFVIHEMMGKLLADFKNFGELCI